MGYFTDNFNYHLEESTKVYTRESIEKEVQRIQKYGDADKAFTALWNLFINSCMAIIIMPSVLAIISGVAVIIITALVGTALTKPSGKKNKLQKLNEKIRKQEIKTTVAMRIGTTDNFEVYNNYLDELKTCRSIIDEALIKM